MNSVVTIYIIFSLLLRVATSAPEFSFRDILGISTLTPTTQTTKPQSTLAPIVTPQENDSSSLSSLAVSGYTINNFTAKTIVSTIESTYRNWVGPVTKSPDTACYREAHIAKTCPLAFNKKLGMCWAQCPLAYPVKCGMECIRQNDDCKMEIITKTAVVVQATVAMGAFNIYGNFKKMAKAVQTTFRCVKDMSIMIRQLTKYIRGLKVNDPQTPQDKVLAMLYYSDKFIFDIPVAISSCMGIIVKPNVRFADKITNTAELVVRELISRH
ncbi:unnamed protein product [Phytophthora fragariaefolia]|uniref:Unnamed protein product n=1 Tax=Phytophthora fragariaefolia TaxID=1490495 RepID=A0A9W7D6C7_9STRA|nr:unnamed protein product [Phytophthora fragariaefolia]